MKARLFLLLLVFLSGGPTASAQLEKGTWFLNGLNILSFQVGTSKFSDNVSSSKNNITDFYVGPSFLYGSNEFVHSPSINYCFSDNVSGGIFLNLNLNSEKDQNDQKTHVSVFAIGPTVRYNFMVKQQCIPFVEGKFGLGSYHMKSGNSATDKSDLIGFYLGAGATYFFKPKIGMDFTIGYGNLVNKWDDSFNSKTTLSVVNFGIGILVPL